MLPLFLLHIPTLTSTTWDQEPTHPPLTMEMYIKKSPKPVSLLSVAVGAGTASPTFTVPPPRPISTRTPDMKPQSREIKSRTPDMKPQSREIESRTPEIKPQSREIKSRTPEIKPLTQEIKSRTPEIVSRIPDYKLRTPEIGQKIETGEEVPICSPGVSMGNGEEYEVDMEEENLSVDVRVRVIRCDICVKKCGLGVVFDYDDEM
ncbi:hypothetical protein ACHWQZ_G018062 [Mnemiopsis leidyi]